MTDHPVERALGAETFARLRARLRETNALIRERGIREYEGRRLVTGYSSREFYDWDLYFENLYLAAFGVAEFCRSNLEAFLARQLVTGFTARTLLKIRPYQQFKPFLAQIALLYCRQTGEWSWPDGALWERLVRYLDYWFWYCDFDKNGLAVWDSATTPAWTTRSAAPELTANSAWKEWISTAIYCAYWRRWRFWRNGAATLRRRRTIAPMPGGCARRPGGFSGMTEPDFSSTATNAAANASG